MPSIIVCFLGKNQEPGVSRSTGQYVSTTVETWCVYFVLNGADFRGDTPWRMCLVQLQNSMHLFSSDGIGGGFSVQLRFSGCGDF